MSTSIAVARMTRLSEEKFAVCSGDITLLRGDQFVALSRKDDSGQEEPSSIDIRLRLR